MNRVLVTGSAGLIGVPLSRSLTAAGIEVVSFDLNHPTGRGYGDVRDEERIREALRGCSGIIHLAAVSRVHVAEQAPELCRSVNICGTRNILAGALAQAVPPWVVLASSREVYGQADELPVSENAPLRPINVYGRSKLAGERLAARARMAGARVGIVRLANVYGSPADHPDRVVPAFSWAAVKGETLRVHGAENSFDFVHVDDTVSGIEAVARCVAAGDQIPSIQLVSGRATTLEGLAMMAIGLAGTEATLEVERARRYAVSRFHGCPERARLLLGWRAGISIQHGLERLIGAFRSSVAVGALS